MQHFIILILIIATCGILGGIVNFLRQPLEFQSSKHSKLKSIINGIAASALVPLFLKMISSDLLSTSINNPIEYFTIGGFCLITSIFSNKFIDSIGDKVMNRIDTVSQEIKEVEKEVKEVKSEVENVITESEITDTRNSFTSIDILESIELDVINSINNSKYAYRALSGIAKDILLTKNETLEILTNLENKGMVQKSLRSNNQHRWRITDKGLEVISEYYGDEISES